MSKQKNKFFSVPAVLLIVGLSIAGENEKLSTDALHLKEYRIERTVSTDAKECINCHSQLTPGLVADWSKSRHAHANITCLDCHKAGPADKDISKNHLVYNKALISAIVSPKDCSRCHPSEAA